MTRLKVHTWMPFGVMLAAAVVISSTVISLRQFGPTLFINITPSEPRGVYRLRLHAPDQYVRGMYVIFPVPKEVESLVYGRGWLPKGAPFLKEIRGLVGDQVCILTHGLIINGQRIGPVLAFDSHGLPLPQRQGCQRLELSQFFAASTYLDRSFDGRYFGPLSLLSIVGEAVPLWTY